MAYGYVSDLIQTLQDYEILDIILPFFLVFTIIFATLQKVKILGEGKKNFNVIVALIVAITFIVPHVTDPGGPLDFVKVINTAIPSVSLVAIALIMVFLLVGLFGVSPKWGGPFTGFFALASFVFVGYIFAASAGLFEVPVFLNDDRLMSLIIVLLVFGGIIAFVTGEEKPEKAGFFKSIGDMFEGRK